MSATDDNVFAVIIDDNVRTVSYTVEFPKRLPSANPHQTHRTELSPRRPPIFRSYNAHCAHLSVTRRCSELSSQNVVPVTCVDFIWHRSWIERPGEGMGSKIPGSCSPRVTTFCIVVRNIFSIIIAVCPVTYRDVSHTCTGQKTHDNSEVHTSHQNCGSASWNQLRVTV